MSRPKAATIPTPPGYQAQLAEHLGQEAGPSEEVEAEVHRAAQEDAAIADKLKGAGDVPLIFPDDEERGSYSLVKPEHVTQALREGARMAAPDEVARVEDELKKRQAYGGALGTVAAGGAGFMRGLIPFGISDELMIQQGGAINALSGGFGPPNASLLEKYEAGKQKSREALREVEHRNPYLSGGSELVGMGTGLALTGGGSAAAEGAAAGLKGAEAFNLATAPTRAISAAGRGAEKLAEKGVARLGAGKTIQKLAGLGAQAGTEGAVYGLSGAVDESILEDTDLSVQKALAGAGHGAILGAPIGVGLGAAGHIFSKGVDAAGGLLARRLEGRALEAEAARAERQAVIDEFVSEGHTPEEAEAMFRASDRKFTTDTAVGDKAAALMFKSFAPTAKYTRRFRNQFGDTFDVQLGSAAMRENIRTLEDAVNVDNKIVDELADAYGNLPIQLNPYQELQKATARARALEAEPYSKEKGTANAAWRYVEELEKYFGLKQEVKKAGREIKSPRIPADPSDAELYRVARKEGLIGDAPADPRIAIREELERQYPRPGKWNPYAEADKIRKEYGYARPSKGGVGNLADHEEMARRGLPLPDVAVDTTAHERAVQELLAKREAEHNIRVAAWDNLVERVENTAPNRARIQKYTEQMAKYNEDLAAAKGLVKERHDKKVMETIADWVNKTDELGKANAEIAARNRARMEKTVTIGEWRDFRKQVDAAFREKGVFDAEKIWQRNQVSRAARNSLEQAGMNAIADYAKATGNEELYRRVAVAKQRKVEVSALREMMENSRAHYAQNNIFPLGAKIAGAAGGNIGAHIGSAVLGPIGGLVGSLAGAGVGALGTKYAREKGVPALAEYLYKNSGAAAGTHARLLEARNIVHAAGKRMENAAKAIVEEKNLATSKALVPGKPGESDLNLYKRAEKILRTLDDPQAMQEYVQKRLGALAQDAPKFATAYATRLGVAVQYLRSQMPKNREPSNPLQPHLNPPRPPNDMEIARFARVLHAVEKPLDVIDLMARNRLTKDHVAALREVYPGIYQEMRDRIFAELQRSKKSLSYPRLIQLGTYFDAALDPTARPENKAAWQASFKFKPQSPAGTAGVNPSLLPNSKKQGRPAGSSQPKAVGSDVHLTNLYHSATSDRGMPKHY